MTSATIGRVAVTALLVVLGSIAGAAGSGRDSDERFIESLERVTDVDRPRLARVLFGLAAALDAGRSSVRLSQGGIVVPDTSRDAVVSLLRRRFVEYETALDALREGATRLLERPTSDVLLYDALVEGQRSCWALDRHDRLVETYASSGGISVLSSREACVKLRSLTFRPGVVQLVRRTVAAADVGAERVAELEEELAALEALLDDLRLIDEAD